jgi:DNA repair photolyase
VTVKTNAPDLLRRELDPGRRRVPLKRSFILVGGGVGDAYQPAEEEYGLTRRVLEVIRDYGFAVHILTKSVLVERDLNLLKAIRAEHGVIVSMSFSTVDDEISALFEPHAAPPSQRFRALERIKRSGLNTGVYFLPALPFISDSVTSVDRVVRQAREAGADFLVCGGLTLKEGQQREHFRELLQAYYPERLEEYTALYPGNRWGTPREEYGNGLSKIVSLAAQAHGLPIRIPSALIGDELDENDLVTVILDNIDYLLRLEDRPSSFRGAAFAVSQLKEPLSAMGTRRRGITGVGPATERIIREILRTGTCGLHESLLNHRMLRGYRPPSR